VPGQDKSSTKLLRSGGSDSATKTRSLARATFSNDEQSPQTGWGTGGSSTTVAAAK
jgi:hypothetical protein